MTDQQRFWLRSKLLLISHFRERERKRDYIVWLLPSRSHALSVATAYWQFPGTKRPAVAAMSNARLQLPPLPCRIQWNIFLREMLRGQRSRAHCRRMSNCFIIRRRSVCCRNFALTRRYIMYTCSFVYLFALECEIDAFFTWIIWNLDTRYSEEEKIKHAIDHQTSSVSLYMRYYYPTGSLQKNNSSHRPFMPTVKLNWLNNLIYTDRQTDTASIQLALAPAISIEILCKF